jgi:hypothetical protein
MVISQCSNMSTAKYDSNLRVGNYLAGQLVKPCHLPAFNCSEAQAAELRTDLYIS